MVRIQSDTKREKNTDLVRDNKTCNCETGAVPTRPEPRVCFDCGVKMVRLHVAILYEGMADFVCVCFVSNPLLDTRPCGY